ncbi:MAG TPA: hypothetical protein VMT58_00050, partial [Candidatus Binataceae bacterium]|nr:hypothetical protein [Candidatus Binataceae bacterium]
MRERRKNMPLFGEPPIELSILAGKLTSGKDLRNDTIKRILFSVGTEEYKYIVHCTLSEQGLQGWLLDLVWLEKGTLAIKLAVEDER